ncbi:Ribonuclease H-like domain,HAT, C-terminal dimerisation domain,Domain of unknown function DUF4371 [Cinara cedri]|uniref:HAT C-terminal dimerisation domain-containing protein n=1 Tax=Cinara cedri TaxID=506608 RepID=A0A5E4MD90_9HEMI|nr:Ribonuclease H-like domain,HAT, C-terminal dimerisation domain,Domain of unknown function DUF4371 [Cinara cedri]
MNSIQELLKLKFTTLSFEKKMEIKSLGRPLPTLFNLIQESKKGNKIYRRRFNPELFQKYKWLCGCETNVKLFCFPCVCFGGDWSWSKTGVTDLIHLLSKINKHENSFKHIQNEANLKILGTVNIDAGYKLGIKRHNEQVYKNRDVLEKILNCVKFCGKYELPLCDRDVKVKSKNQGVFCGLIDLYSNFDQNLRDHLQNSMVFNEPSKTIQNELLDCILNVVRNQILIEIHNSDFVSIIVDETTDTANSFQLALIFRYEINGKPVEHFWGYLNPKGHNVESLTQTILKEINPILEKTPSKLIAQSYDGVVVMSDQNTRVNTRVKEKYPFANFVHCYAHQLNLIMIQATSQNKQIKIFFSNLSEISEFFSSSPQRVAVLNDIVGSRLPRTVQTCWNFHIKTINTVYEYRESLIECMDKIVSISLQSCTINKATGLKRLLTDETFIFWLTIFHKIMPHVDCLHKVVQAKNTDPVQIQKSIDCFTKEISKIRDDMTNICQYISKYSDIENTFKRRKIEDNINSRKLAALEVCDVLSIQAQSRFDFTKHLTIAKLFQNDKYEEYKYTFPLTTLNIFVECYPFFVQERLKTELEVMYSRDDFHSLCGVIPTINYISNNNMEDTFKEVFKLLKLLVVIPMTSSEAERSFSTLKRIKTCLRGTMNEERLNALTMLSIESCMINEDNSFNQKVINEFIKIKERKMNFVYVDV